MLFLLEAHHEQPTPFQQLPVSLFVALYWAVSANTLVLAAPIDLSAAQEAQSGLLELRFGATTFAFERGEIGWVSGHGKPDRSVPTLTVARNASVFFKPPFDIPACLDIGQVVITNQTIEPIVRQRLFLGYTPAVTEYRGISQLRPPSGRPILDLYQFEASDLKDFWGEQITFYRESLATDVKIQLTRDTHLRVAATAERCFFERGEAAIRQLISFVIGKIKK
ncbi:hypothetical protein [Bradyrhizobium sp. SBR1B]|uniref:hypothetical protein n=1 Tax=Bradyrhizobium sp. SBR1B TaxID=2663836 RepID=UPI001605D25E|nr:hypothetical protein [Bradyrhizobium sp. SBR1B]MBB4382953.1 hypothetical protein [Bradyrhizobium sp. SBR1B]